MAKKATINRDNPALSFISSVRIEDAPEAEIQSEAKEITSLQADKKKPVGIAPEGLKYVEKRTHRLQLVLQPSVYEAVKQRAEEAGQSVNDYIHKLLEKEIGE